MQGAERVSFAHETCARTLPAPPTDSLIYSAELGSNTLWYFHNKPMTDSFPKYDTLRG